MIILLPKTFNNGDLSAGLFPITLVVLAHILPFLVPFVTTLFNGCLRPILHPDDGPWNGIGPTRSY